MARFWGIIAIILIVGFFAGLGTDRLALILGDAVEGVMTFIRNFMYGVSN